MLAYGKPRELLHRQRVHVGAQHDGGAVAVAQHADDAGLPDPRRHLVAGGAKPLRRDACSPGLLHREFGVRVEIGVQLLQLREQPVERSEQVVRSDCMRHVPSIPHQKQTAQSPEAWRPAHDIAGHSSLSVSVHMNRSWTCRGVESLASVQRCGGRNSLTEPMSTRSEISGMGVIRARRFASMRSLGWDNGSSAQHGRARPQVFTSAMGRWSRGVRKAHPAEIPVHTGASLAGNDSHEA